MTEIQTSVAPSEIWLRDNLENIYALLFRFLGVRLPAGNEQRGLAHDAEVRHSGAGSDRFRAVAGAPPTSLPAQCHVWEASVIETRYLRDLDRIDGEPMEFEWTIFPGFTTFGNS